MSPFTDRQIYTFYSKTPGRRRWSRKGVPKLRHRTVAIDKHWYPSWPVEQLKTLPPPLQNIRVCGSPTSKTGGFERLVNAIDQYALETDGVSIDEIIENLWLTDVLEKKNQSIEVLQYHRALVFACLGWRSMLFLPAFNVCSFAEFAIHNDDQQARLRVVHTTLLSVSRIFREQQKASCGTSAAHWKNAHS